MTKKCFYCGDVLTEGDFLLDKATMIMPETYAHTGCIAERGDGSIVNDQTKDILGAADYAHQSIGLAKELLQESLGNVGQILTCGCMDLGPASLGSTMRLGQKLKEFSFLLDDLLKDAHGLCVLLGHDLGVCEGEPVILSDPRENPGVFVHGLFRGPPCDDDEPHELGLSYGDRFSPMDVLDSDDFGPGEEEFDDNEQPF